MFASKHAVFVGPGQLPEELREVLRRREGEPPPELTSRAPRLLATFSSAADAERAANEVQRLRIGTLVAGPEQTPVEDSWLVARALDDLAGEWKIETPAGETRALRGRDVVGLSIVDWRPEKHPADRAVLVKLRETDRPVLLRARALDTVAQTEAPLDAFRRLNHFIDACVLDMPKDARVRSRRVTDAELGAGELEGDLLPLAVAMVDSLDQQQAMVGPVSGGATPSKELRRVEYTPLGATLAWSFWAGSLGLFCAAGALMAIGAWDFSMHGVLAVGLGVLLAALASQRIMWSRYLAHGAWGKGPKVPHFPLSSAEPGKPPHWPGLSLDASSLALALFLARWDGSIGFIAALLPLALVPMTLLTALAAWDETRQ